MEIFGNKKIADIVCIGSIKSFFLNCWPFVCGIRNPVPRQETETQDFGDVSQYRELNAIGTGESRDLSSFNMMKCIHYFVVIL